MDNLNNDFSEVKITFESIDARKASVELYGSSLMLRAAVLSILEKIAELGGNDVLDLLTELIAVAEMKAEPLTIRMMELLNKNPSIGVYDLEEDEEDEEENYQEDEEDEEDYQAEIPSELKAIIDEMIINKIRINRDKDISGDDR